MEWVTRSVQVNCPQDGSSNIKCYSSHLVKNPVFFHIAIYIAGLKKIAMSVFPIPCSPNYYYYEPHDICLLSLHNIRLIYPALNITITQKINIIYNTYCLLSKLRANQSLSAHRSGDSQAFAVESNCGTWLWKLRPHWSPEVIFAYVHMMSEQVGITSDTNLTGMHCVSIGVDRFCAGLVHLERTYFYIKIMNRGNAISWDHRISLDFTGHNFTWAPVEADVNKPETDAVRQLAAVQLWYDKNT